MHDEYPFIIGSAGHIDHGKTTLVRALTGVDCDRLGEEKRRGITIELGFAPLLLPSGRTVSIIDVPGHERFIKQMVSGAAGIDAVMLVVAADEGVMPQTREHLDILKLLGISHGLVVLCKKDIVDDELLELAESDVEQLVKGTFLEGAPIFSVSAITGDGIEPLREELDALVSRTPLRDRRGAFFMPIDRVFSMKGFGSVVTGTSFHGILKEGDEVDVMPSALRTRVRSIQVHGVSSTEATAGQRVAVNLASVSMEQVNRGDVLCAKGRFSPTECIEVELHVLPSAPEPLIHWQRLHMHIGTTDVLVRVSMLNFERSKNGAVEPGESALVQLFPEEPITAAVGERFVLRFYSPLTTIGGGRVLLPYAKRPQNSEDRRRRESNLIELVRDFSEPALLSAIIKDRGIIDEQNLFDLSQLERPDFVSAVRKISKTSSGSGIVVFGTARRIFLSPQRFEMISGAINTRLGDFHKEHPELSGLEADELFFAAHTGKNPDEVMELKDFKELLGVLVQIGRICSDTSERGTSFRSADFKPTRDDKLQLIAEKICKLADEAGFALVEISSLPEAAGATQSTVNRAIGYLREQGGLKITESGFLLPDVTFKKLMEVLSAMDGELTVGAVRDALGTSRKLALAMLEFLDSQGITRRVGDKRTILKGKSAM